MATGYKAKLTFIGLAVFAWLLIALGSGRAPSSWALSLIPPDAPTHAGVLQVLNVQGDLSGSDEQVLPVLKPEHIYSLSLSVDTPRDFGAEGSLRIILRDAAREICRKDLHMGDPDVYVTWRPTAPGAGKITLEAVGPVATPPHYRLKVLQWKAAPDDDVYVETEPNNNWREANPIRLGGTVFATADDQEYIPRAGEGDLKTVDGGEDWYRFEFTEDRPRLAYFMLDLAERDNIPVDVRMYRRANGELKLYEEGVDPVTPPHEVQALAGNKFTTRVLKEKGTYYLRVVANHPFYQLRTRVYDLPPYAEPQQAVRTAADYILRAGDSWHANTPRKGGLYDRVANVHQETSLCVACHATHFPLRAQLYALRNGYPAQQRPPLQFMTERFYNNPRPFYGHPDASWARVISAPANVLSRMAVLLDIYESEVTHERRDPFFKSVGEYLKLYYKGRAKLPPDESNGNTPLVSQYEVAWYSWVVLDALYNRTGDKSYLDYREALRGLIEQTDHKNMVDLCYQTLALCTIDKARYREPIRKNTEKILSLQRPSGQWALSFDPDAPDAEFQTGHCLWALAVAGYKADDPRLAKAVQYLMKRQQPFGGWFDPAQPYENFRTPFRETQMAVLALSELFKGPEYRDPTKKDTGPASGKGWERGFPAPPVRLDFSRMDRLLKDIDNLWDPPTPALLSDVITAARHEDPLVRQSAVACLGRVGDAAAVAVLKNALGDPNKMVQRTAAWSLRQLAVRKGLGVEAIQAALSDGSDRVRWGATRVFATHFSSLARRADLAERLLALAQDPLVAIRVQALKALWQWWYWNDDEKLRSRIEDTFIARLAEPEHPWVRRNLQEGLYNIADENIRYLYNNWVPLMASPQDRERTIQARLAIEARLADKIATALRTGNERQRQGLLAGLTEFHLRNGGSYEPGKAAGKSSGTLYVRIGNDIETIQFFGQSAEMLAQALRPLLDSADSETRRLATKAAFMLREVPAARNTAPASDLRQVAALAGSYEEGRRLLVLSIYRRLLDPEKEVRVLAQEVARAFTLDAGKQGTEVTGMLSTLLRSPYEEARGAALEVIRKYGPSPAAAPDLGESVKKLLEQEATAPAALRTVRAFPHLYRDAAVIGAIEKALTANDARAMSAALELALQVPDIGRTTAVAATLDRLLATKDPKRRKAILDSFAVNRSALEDRRVLSLLSEALVDADTGVIGAALSLVRQERSLQKNPAILAALADLSRNPKAPTAAREAADGLYQGKSPADRPVGRVNGGPARLLDYAFFIEKVQPILAARGQDGNACAQCHASHAIFKLNPPPSEGRYAEAQLRENYRSALKVVNMADPEKSLILRKPTSSSESEGVVGSDRVSHGGGQRWPADSPEYRTILEWINGAKITSAKGSAH